MGLLSLEDSIPQSQVVLPLIQVSSLMENLSNANRDAGMTDENLIPLNPLLSWSVRCNGPNSH